MALMEVNFYSTVLDLTLSMQVIIPQDGAKEIESYPTLYLLHGMGGDQTSWLRKTSIERYVEETGMAVVMPTTHLGWYTNTASGLKYWEFISEELPRICRKFFPKMSVKREETFVAGLSMGGYGAYKLALSRPDLFGAAASLSGALDMATAFDGETGWEKNAYWQGVFGENLGVNGTENDLFTLAEKCTNNEVPLPVLYQWCGKQDFLYDQNLRAHDKFTDLGYDITASFTDGDHSWQDWDDQIRKVIKWIEKLK